MDKNVKRIFFAVTILTLLVAVSAVSASDISDDTPIADSLQDNVVSDTPQVASSDAVVTSNDAISEQTTSPTENDIADTKNMGKTCKELKKDSITIDGIEYTNIIEDENIFELYIDESTFINNVQVSYSLETEAPVYVNNSIINSEFNIYDTAVINNSIINSELNIFETTSIHNSTLNCELYVEEDVIVKIDESTTLGDEFGYSCDGTIIINDINKLLPYMEEYKENYAFNNVVITKPKSNYANISFTNSTLNSTIHNEGTITISDDTILGKNFGIEGDGEIIINDTDKLLPYFSMYDGNYTLSNIILSGKEKTNDGNMTLINCIIDLGYWTSSWGWNYYSIGEFTNNGNLKLINCTLNCTITNTGNLIIDKCLTPSSGINNQGNLTISNVEWEQTPAITLSQRNIPSHTTIINSTFTNNQLFINAYPGADIEVYNSTFNNMTRAITNVDNLIIDNCNFTNNGYNTRLVSAVNVNVSNSKFINNSVGNGYGTLCFSNGNVTNCEFINNSMTANDAWNIYNGVAISATGSSVNISNNLFENNTIDAIEGQIVGDWEWHDYHTNGYGTIVIRGAGNTVISNNTFTNCSTNQKASAIYLEDINKHLTSNYTCRAEIYNNTFNDMKSASETILCEISAYYKNNPDVTFGDIYIHDNIYNNSTIDFDNLIVNDPLKVFAGDEITLKANVQLLNPECYDENILEKTQYNWYISGENIITDSTEYTLTVPEDTMIIYVRPTISNTRSKLLVLNPMVVTDKIITPENINKNLFEGELIGIQANTRLLFQGNFTNLGEIYSNTNSLVFDGTNATFTNTSFKIEANDTTIQNMTINNIDTSNYSITTIGNNNLIRNNNLIQYNSNGLTAAIKDLNSKNTIITNNTINVTGPARDITYGSGASIANTQAILSINTDTSTIEYNNITVQNSTDSELAPFGTIEAITAPQGKNNKIQYNNIKVTGSRFVYGINTLDTVKNNQIIHNNITATGYRYTDGIQVGNGAQDTNIAYNNINLTCFNDTPVDEAAISYGIIITSQGGETSINNNIQENNITINGAVNYGIEVYTSSNTDITQNNIILTGVKSMGIGYAHSPNSQVTKNTIIINDDSSQPLNSVTEEIQPASIGIRIQQDSDSITIENNIIKTNDIEKTDKTISTEDSHAMIRFNKLISSTGYGSDSITTNPEKFNIIRDNTIISRTTMEIPKIILTNSTVEVKIYVVDEYYNPVNGGYVTFRKGWDTIGNITVTNGIATTNLTFTEIETSYIIATYFPTSDGLNASSDEKTISIEEARTVVTIEETAMIAGESVTLTARVTDQAGNNINGGKITFKVNGKTLKDANGKTIYARVVDGVATATYEVPMDASGKDLNITAVYSGSGKYDKQTTTTTVTVIEATPTLTITPFNEPVTTGSTVTLKAKVALGDTPITPGKIVFKINGKTVKDANGKVIYAKVDANGEVSVDYNIGDLKANTYTVEAVFTASGYDKLTSNTTMTVVKA